MNDYQERLTKLLLEKNDFLSYAQARVWVELLWEDFEATNAKAGTYYGSEMTERIVKQWIEKYGENLHEFAVGNAKYQQYFAQEKHSFH
ncbi:YfhJ family protein [Bacillota bacterium Lsc_1132]